MAGDFAYCANLVREADKDRFLATLFAPADKRSDLLALYAFDLETAGIAGRVRDSVAGEIRFQWWHDTIAASNDGSGHPVADTLRAVLARRGIAGERLLAMIDARRSALYAEKPSEAELELLGSETDGAIVVVAAEILFGSLVESIRLASHHAGVASLASKMQGADLEFDAAELARRHLAALRGLIPELPQPVLPAFLPLALVAQSLARPLPQWRKQWILWRASKNLTRWL